MKNLKSLLLTLAVLVPMSSALAAQEPSPRPPANSAKSSPRSDTRANEPVASRESGVGSRTVEPAQPNTSASILQAQDPRLVDACAAAVEDLRASRALIAALDAENASLKARLATEQELTATLNELNDTRRQESDALRSALSAKNETIAAKDAAIAAQDRLIEALKHKRPSPWRRIGDILIGAAAIAIFK